MLFEQKLSTPENVTMRLASPISFRIRQQVGWLVHVVNGFFSFTLGVVDGARLAQIAAVGATNDRFGLVKRYILSRMYASSSHS